MKKTSVMKKILIIVTIAVILSSSVMITESWIIRNFCGPVLEIPTGLMGFPIYREWDLNYDFRMQLFELFWLADVKIRNLFHGFEGLWFKMIIQFIILTIILQETTNKKRGQLK